MEGIHAAVARDCFIAPNHKGAVAPGPVHNQPCCLPALSPMTGTGTQVS
jgi:hypothetical protein